MDQTSQWVTAAPFWDTLPAGNLLSPAAVSAASAGQRLARGAAARPAILRFASDSFMDEMMTILANDPSVLPQIQAVNEDWRGPVEPLKLPEGLPQFARRLNRTGLASVTPAAAGVSTLDATTPTSPAAPQRLLLYQPVHQRFYLVSACLVCPQTGMPDCVIDLGKGERASFLVRRLRPKIQAGPDGKPTLPADPPPPDPISWQTNWEEYALVKEGKEVAWQRLAYPDLPPDNEERLPLFPLNYQAADARRRRLLAGLVPVSRREAYLGAPLSAVDSPNQPAPELPAVDPRLALFLGDVIAPWNSLIDQAGRAAYVLAKKDKDSNPKGSDANKIADDARSSIQLTSWYTLVDFYDFLTRYLPETGKSAAGLPANPSPEETDLIAILSQPLYASGLPADFRDRTSYPAGAVLSSVWQALAKIAQLEAADSSWRGSLDGISVAYNRNNPDPAWPAFLFPLADLSTFTISATDAEDDLKAGLDAQRLKTSGMASPSGVRDLYSLVAAALQNIPLPARSAALPLAAQPVMDAGQTGWFIVRMIYECPNCGPLRPAVVSAPSVVFQMASFFEPRAPARPIRISLPMNTTPAGFRQFAKNTAFMVSDVLACQKERMGGLTLGDLVLSVLPWPFHKDLPADNSSCSASGVSMGMICSLSIPIITICALILLMIIVSLFDLIFHWIPYFILCFPLPGFSAKKGNSS